jgi:hypothetical protein
MEANLRPNDARDLPSDAAAVHRSLIHVRLPASILSTLSEKSRIEISHHVAGAVEGGDGKLAIADDGLTLKITQSGSRDSFPLEIDHQKRHTIEWYRSAVNLVDQSGGEDRAPNQSELHHIGTTNKQYIIKAPSTTDLKKIGERTRRLLEEERKNRKEIVRLDDNDRLPLPEKEAKAPPEKSPQMAVKMPHKRTGAKSSTNARKRKRHVASNIDGWMPNVDDLRSNDTNKDGLSNIVRLHGLPVGVKPEHIRKFFHGLNPSFIFVLPSFSHRIQGWDAAYSTEEIGGCMVKRHPNHFRVFAKFTSYPVANAAIERSGESIAIDSEGAACCKSEITGASISMAPVSKSDASFIRKHMVSCKLDSIHLSSLHMHGSLQIYFYQAIPTRKGEPVIVTLKNTEKRLGRVAELIWRMAIKMLNLKHSISEKDGVRYLAYLSSSRTEPANKVQFQKLAKLYNQLIDTHAELELDPGLLFMHTFDPTLDEDPVHRITQSVSNWLLDEISIIGNLLTQV